MPAQPNSADIQNMANAGQNDNLLVRQVQSLITNEQATRALAMQNNTSINELYSILKQVSEFIEINRKHIIEKNNEARQFKLVIIAILLIMLYMNIKLFFAGFTKTEHLP